MNSSAYLSVDVEECRRKQHQFKIAGSDKTPLKRSLICLTCSEATGKSAFCAYGDDGAFPDGRPKSWGAWRNMRRERETAEPDPAGEEAR